MVESINSVKAFELLSSNKNAYLIDVRTKEEHKLTGVPDLTLINKQVIYIPWQFFPDMSTNPNFIREIRNMFADKSVELLFMCRSGYRSHQAALAAYADGYTRCYNVVDGFEGSLDNNRHRNSIHGWKFSSLPWIQD